MGFMATPGWYPDPDGSSTPRYWNGEDWEESSRGRTNTRSATRSNAWILGVGALTLLIVVSVILWQPWKSNPWSSPTDNNSSRPTGRQWDETAPSESPTSPQPSDGRGRPTACPIAQNPSPPAPKDNWFSSGGIRYQGVPGWRTSKASYIDFASERSGQDDHVTDSWVSVTAIGQLSKTDYSADTRIAAKQLISCLSTSYYYKYLDRVESLEDKSFRTADGVEGWLIRANFWNKPGYHAVLGDEVVVVILDQGAPNTITLFSTQAPIGDSARQEMVKKSLDSLGRG